MPDKLIKKFICIHGHFYQPPRENPWLDEIQIQESAAPYHDWNEKIAEECYGPNSASKLLDESGRICDIRNNYSDISFNFGPTLMSWLHKKHSKIYKRIIQADSLSKLKYGGEGAAMAQVYNHVIMPLATREEKEIQVYWGVYDFKKRFGRLPEGMWLSETAVDLETLMVLTKNGIKYTVLAPGQANKWRNIGDAHWQKGIDTRHPYLCKLPDGTSITLFFYNGDLSQAVAFGGLLNDGKAFSKALLNGFDSTKDDFQIVHLATDGETFGHHHRHGDMALAYAIEQILQDNNVEICNYSSFLSKVPVSREVVILENTSWSCMHGIERWRSDCGCKTGGEESWNQKWRSGLRNSLISLKRQLDVLFTEHTIDYFSDSQSVIKQYIELFYDRNPSMLSSSLKSIVNKPIDEEETTRILRLLEMQRMSQFMFTSCAWFFNDPSGIETTQILQYAKRAVQLAELACGVLIEPSFKQSLLSFKSNIIEYGNGLSIYEKVVVPEQLTLTQLGMHYAVHSIFNGDDPFEVLNYYCHLRQSERLKVGSFQFISGIADVYSNITLAKEHFAYFIIHLGNQQFVGSTWTNVEDDTFITKRNSMAEVFLDGNYAEIIYMMKMESKSKYFSFSDLLKDEQKALIDKIMLRQMDEVEDDFMNIHDKIYGLMNHVRKAELQVPGYFIKNLESINSIRIEKLIDASLNKKTLDELGKVVKEVKRWSLEVDRQRLMFLSSIKIDDISNLIFEEQDKDEWYGKLYLLSDFVRLLYEAGIEPDLYEIANLIISKQKESGFNMERDIRLKYLVELLNLCL